VNCAVAEKRLAGYKIVDVNAELAPYREDLRVGLCGSTYLNLLYTGKSSEKRV